jgi:hypothetical protein
VGFLAKPPVLVVLALNLVPVACVLWFGWSAFLLLFLYWAENVVIGVFNAIKMLATGVAMGIGGVMGCLFVVPFFLIHYGGFCAGHLFFVMMVGRGISDGGLNPQGALEELVQNQNGLMWSAAALIGIQVFVLIDWFVRKRWRDNDPMKQMGEPYGRVIILHLSLLFGAFLLGFNKDGIGGVLLLGVFKTLYEGAATGRRIEQQAQAGTQPIVAPNPA